MSKSEIRHFESFCEAYKLVSKIGEGTFSTVFKAVDRYQEYYDNNWMSDYPRLDHKYVAIKKIYVTSSPVRIMNELKILQLLSNSDHVVSLITAFRNKDQVYVVLPYFRHVDFRLYHRDESFTLRHIRYYMRSLFYALCDIHSEDIVHRDIKPSNFLYDLELKKGQLVDFGLAEPLSYDSNSEDITAVMEEAIRTDSERKITCRCYPTLRKSSGDIFPPHISQKDGYIKTDKRQSKRANRAGTRGFRAPEVLFKCDNQGTAIDIWAAGVVLLIFLTKRFPFFNSNDDVEALIELACIFGVDELRKTAQLHSIR